ncbi:hypothetical protein HMPREF0281_00615 [Corynebacterium ammoniagenes DSM 20306]|uniref:Uncharacterized protein n=1 Tax=Corynebacterium ammoniagenes DSM 20306 TaxID=649754 RepID=A0ABN0AHC5_CORAM|nr:hypothetical protein HMPREF0281_00615 [Corynebacterium ammoniagenes DSM 20306]
MKLHFESFRSALQAVYDLLRNCSVNHPKVNARHIRSTRVM